VDICASVSNEFHAAALDSIGVSQQVEMGPITENRLYGFVGLLRLRFEGVLEINF